MDIKLKKRLFGAIVILAIIIIFVPMLFKKHENSNTQPIMAAPTPPEQPQLTPNQTNTQQNTPQLQNSPQSSTMQQTTPNTTNKSQANSGTHTALNIQSTNSTAQSAMKVQTTKSSVMPTTKQHLTANIMPKPHSSANSLTPMATDTQAKIQQLQQEVLKEQTNIQQQRRNQSKFKKKTLIKKNISAKQQNKINTAPFTVSDIQVKKFNIRHSNVTSGNVYDSAAEQQQQNISQTKATLRKQAYVIQLGVFGNSDHADRLIAKLRRKGFNAFGYKQQIKHKILTHVYVGPMITRKHAKVMRSKLHKDMKIKGMITKFDATNLH